MNDLSFAYDREFRQDVLHIAETHFWDNWLFDEFVQHQTKDLEDIIFRVITIHDTLGAYGMLRNGKVIAWFGELED